MGTQTAPNFLVTLVDIADGLPETGLSVVLVPRGGSLGVDDIVLSEITTTGKYVKSTADGVDAIDQGSYLVYADAGSGFVYRGSIIHGGEDLEAHTLSTSDPHSVVAQQVAVTDTGSHFTGSDVETVLQEIGDALDDVPTVAAAILLDDSNQQVSSVKPKVTNLNADKVDGYHVGGGAGQLVVMGADGKVPSANMPANSPGDASTLNGLPQGQGSGKIPKWNSAASHNDLDTSIAGIKTTGLNGHLALVSNAGSPPSTKIHTSFLGKIYPLVAHANNLLIQSGWGYKKGDGTQWMTTGLINFPEDFDDEDYIILVTMLSRSASLPTAITDFTNMAANEITAANGLAISKSYGNAYMRNTINFSSSYYYGYSWIAIGTKG